MRNVVLTRRVAEMWFIRGGRWWDEINIVSRPAAAAAEPRVDVTGADIFWWPVYSYKRRRHLCTDVASLRPPRPTIKLSAIITLIGHSFIRQCTILCLVLHRRRSIWIHSIPPRGIRSDSPFYLNAGYSIFNCDQSHAMHQIVNPLMGTLKS